ncbi:MAG: ATP-binding cassette domain-containing protein [Chloroflexi bacterium]|nr:ATP-binding cassette domain-containing protein [Chloroflexota bacterium]MBP7042277.1 ATP-binding cassette domain-containing protein [Chloroflexota bacterium]
MVTHDQNLAARFSRRVHIADGRLVDEAAGGERDTAVPHPHIHLPANQQTNQPINSANQPAIHLRRVVKTYENAAGKFTALKDIDLELHYGQFVSIVGKSGSGKSTLLNMLTGIDHPTSGQVCIGGQDIYKMSESQRALWRGRNVGIVFQFFQLLPTLTLLENTMLPMDYCRVFPAQERPSRALELLTMVGLADHAHALPASVSNGQQQSAAIARALATDPPIIVADEPTGNLDSRAADVVIDVFQELAARGKTILIVTHDPSLTSRTDKTIHIVDGRIVDLVAGQTAPRLEERPYTLPTPLVQP